MSGEFYIMSKTAFYDWDQIAGPFDSLNEAFESKGKLDVWNSRLPKPPRLVVIQIHEKP